MITINIIGFEFLATEDFHTVFHLREDKEKDLVLTEVLEIHFLNMVKWRKLDRKDIANEPLHRWLTWFDENSPPELVAEVVKMDTAIKLAEEKQVHVLSDEAAERAYEMRQRAIWDWNTTEKLARMEGRAEGIAQTNLEIARKMKNAGKSFNEIAEFTGLSLELIENL